MARQSLPETQKRVTNSSVAVWIPHPSIEVAFELPHPGTESLRRGRWLRNG